jgi:hypothetical protein
VSEEKRGRAISFYTVAYVGMVPFGNLLSGALAHRIGAPLTITLNGVAVLAGAALFRAQLPAVQSGILSMYQEAYTSLIDNPAVP